MYVCMNLGQGQLMTFSQPHVLVPGVLTVNTGNEYWIANAAIILLSIYKRCKYVVFRQVGLLAITDRTNVDISIPLKKKKR